MRLVLSMPIIDRLKAKEMREIQASEVKSHLPQRLDDVQRGETIIITRHGKPIARLVPDEDRRRADNAAAIETIKALPKRVGRLSPEELISMREEGRI